MAKILTFSYGREADIFTSLPEVFRMVCHIWEHKNMILT